MQLKIRLPYPVTHVHNSTSAEWSRRITVSEVIVNVELFVVMPDNHKNLGEKETLEVDQFLLAHILKEVQSHLTI